MPQPASSVDLGQLALSFGEAARLPVAVAPPPLRIAGQTYEFQPAVVEGQLDVSRPRSGYALRLRFGLRLAGPCHRCLEAAAVKLEIDAREIHQAGGDEELRSPYVDGDELDVAAWAHDAVSLALPAQVLCREDCAGLCAVCGESLNDADPEQHRHESGGDPRWAKLRELQ